MVARVLKHNMYIHVGTRLCINILQDHMVRYGAIRYSTVW